MGGPLSKQVTTLPKQDTDAKEIGSSEHEKVKRYSTTRFVLNLQVHGRWTRTMIFHLT